jgi:hypothetical protein
VGAYFHHPRFSAGATHGSRTNGAPFWELLYEYGAEFVYGGNDHTYQRFAPQDPDGQLDAARGLRQFVVGTGGTQHYPLGPPLANTQVQHSGTFGVLKLTLHPNSYEWSFLPQAGKSFTDSGSTGCSPLTVDNVAPETTIDAGPSGLSASTLASFSFTASEPGSTFECKLDGGAWQSCTSPRALAGLSQGSHTFRVRATDPAGNTDASEAVRGWTVDTVAPDTTITGGPSGPIASTSASLSFAGEPGAQFECKLDDGAWQSCSSPRALTGLSQGDHTFRVRASDAAGNTGPEATRSWTVDTVAPESSIGAGPAGTVASTAAGFSFSSPDPDAQFECRLDGGQWSACSSPRALTGLSQGPHTFRVRAIDPAGNTGPEAVRTWTVDTLAPSSSITGGPTGTVASGSASFGLSSSEPGSFECQLDGGPWEACSSPHAVGGLADGSHTLRVRATDAAANTGPEATRTWIVDTVAPDTTITGGPSGPTASTSAGLSFSSEPGAQFECKLDDGAWTTCSSPRALTGLSQGPHTFRVRARDSAGNADPTEAVRSWTVDTVAPDTTITAGPSGPTASTSAGFGFGSNEPGSSFECRLDAGPWQSCESPRALTGLGQGDHTFRVRATDAAGNTEATEAARTWTVDTVTPDTTIDSGPSGAVSSNRAELGFGSSEPGVTFECRLDGGAWEPCTAPLVLTGLANGEHTLRVRATDVAGNTDETEATRAWTVDAEPPDTSIASGPAGTVLDTRATFAFAAGEPGATFECRLDGGPWAACVSPHVLTGLSYGTHTFRVRALDALGNADASEAVRTWSVERTPPKLPLPPPKSPPAGEPGPGGGEPPGAALVAARLRADVAGAARALRRAGAAATRKRTRVTLRALMAGRFTVKLTARRGGRLVLLASGTGAARAAGGRTIVLKPARAARRLPARRMRVRLVIEFRDKAGRKVAKGAGFRLSA